MPKGVWGSGKKTPKKKDDRLAILAKRNKGKAQGLSRLKKDDARMEKIRKRTNMTGRPSDYTPELATAICNQIIAGKCLRSIELMDGMPSAASILTWLAYNETFLAQYEKATETRAHARFEKLDVIGQELRDGKIPIQVARFDLDAIKWQCGHERPKRYGDNPVQPPAATDDGMRELAAAIRGSAYRPSDDEK